MINKKTKSESGFTGLKDVQVSESRFIGLKDEQDLNAKKILKSSNIANPDSDNMKQGWEIKKLGDVIEIRNGKNQQEVLSETGQYPIMGSGGNIMGYATDYICEAGTTIIGRKGNISKPIFINEKFWNVDTAFGLYPKNDLPVKFVYYTCLNIDFGSMNRGTTIPSLVKTELLQIPIRVPKSLPEQQRIVAILDEAFAAIAKAKANAQQNLQNPKQLFESYLQGVFENKSKGWEERTLDKVCSEIFAGGDAPKDNYSETQTEKYTIPIYANAVKDRGLYGYTDIARVTKPSITIAARGSGTGHTELRSEAYLPIVRLIVLIPNTEIVTLDFLKYKIDTLDILRSGSAIPQLTIPMIKEYKIPILTLGEQQTIVQKLDALNAETKRLEGIYQQKINDLEELKKSVLQKAFSGELNVGAGFTPAQNAKRQPQGIAPTITPTKTIK